MRPLCLFVVTALGSMGAAHALTIEEAVRLAQSRNERVGIARADLDAANARLAQARSFFFPDLTVNSTYTRRGYETVREIGGEQVTISSRDALNGNATVTAPIFDARAFPLLRQARFARTATEFFTANTERLVGYEAAIGFMQTLGAQQLVAAAERRLEFARTNLNDADARFEAGLVSSNDVTRARLEVANAELAVSRSRTDALAALIALEDLLATDIQSPLQVPRDLIDKVSGVDPELPALIALSGSRLDLRAQRAEVDAMRAFASETSRRFIPRLGFVGQYRATNEGGISGRDEDSTASVNLTWPLWDGGDARAERAQRDAAVRALELELDLQERGAVNDVRTALQRVENEQVSIRSATTAAEAAAVNARETNILYREGLATSLELADAGVQLFESESQQVRAVYDLAIAWLEMRAAAGLPPLPDPNSDDPTLQPGVTQE